MAEWAERHCAQCDDDFCPACYDRLHVGAHMKKHTWAACEWQEIDYGDLVL